ncbi:MAG: histidine phosphatase family protein [Steroidobacteraceae bacterium]|nr:histidine phosphatase family protein [Steroidobacteraceae bacterium]
MIKCGGRCIAIACISVVVVVVGWLFWCGPHTTVLLVRHADRAGTLDQINALGTVRAGVLAHVMDKAPLDAIIRSDAVRAEQTASPTAAAEGLTPIVLAGADVQAFVDEIRVNHRGQRVLVVGHSNTVPDIITALGGPAVTIPDTEFDNLFVLELCRCRGGARLTNLQYGAPTQ